MPKVPRWAGSLRLWQRMRVRERAQWIKKLRKRAALKLFKAQRREIGEFASSLGVPPEIFDRLFLDMDARGVKRSEMGNKIMQGLQQLQQLAEQAGYDKMHVFQLFRQTKSFEKGVAYLRSIVQQPAQAAA